MIQKKTLYLVLCMLFFAQVRLDAAHASAQSDNFSYAQDYEALRQGIDHYLKKSDKTQDVDNKIIEWVNQFKEKLERQSRVYGEDIARGGSKYDSFRDRASAILRYMSSAYIAIESYIQKLKESTGYGWGAPDEDQRSAALNGFNTMIDRLYGHYKELREIVLTQSEQAQATEHSSETDARKVAALAVKVKGYVNQINQELRKVEVKGIAFRKVYTDEEDEHYFNTSAHESFTRLKEDVSPKAEQFLRNIDQLAAQALELPSQIKSAKGHRDEYEELYGQLEDKIKEAQDIERQAKKLFDECSRRAVDLIGIMDQYLQPEYQAKYVKSQTKVTNTKQTPTAKPKAKAKRAALTIGQLQIYSDEFTRLSRITDDSFIRDRSLEGKVRDELSNLEVEALEQLDKEAQSQTIKRLVAEELTQKRSAGKGAKASPSTGELVTLSPAQKALAAGDMKKFGREMNKQYMKFSNSYSGYTHSAWFYSHGRKSTAPAMQKLYVPRLVSMGNSLAHDLDIPADVISVLSASDRRQVAAEVLTYDIALGLAATQLALASSRLPVVSDTNRDSLSLFSSSATKASATPHLSSILMGLDRSQSRLMSTIALEAATIFPDVLTPFFVEPKHRNLFYPVTGKSLLLLDSDVTEAQGLVKFGRIPLSQAMELIPASAADNVVKDAVDVVALFKQRDYKVMVARAYKFLAQIDAEAQSKVGAVNEGAVLANVDLLHKLELLLASFAAQELQAALDEINKTEEDMARADFDQNLELFQGAKPDAVAVLSNRDKMMRLMVSINDAKLDLLYLLADTFDTLQPESQQLALEAGIAAQQTQLLFTSPTLLGGVASASSGALTTRRNPSHAEAALVAHSLGLPKEAVGELVVRSNLEMMRLALQRITLKNLNATLQVKLKLAEENEPSASALVPSVADYHQALAELQLHQVRILRQMSEFISAAQLSEAGRQKVRQIQDKIDSEIQDITAKTDKKKEEKKEDPSRGQKALLNESRTLTESFMKDVVKKAQGWFNKLPNQTGIIRFDDVEKVVNNDEQEGREIAIIYNPSALLYIQGFLQVMAQ